MVELSDGTKRAIDNLKADMAELTRLREENARLLRACQFASNVLENMTTESFRRGADYEARHVLRKAIEKSS